MTRTFASPHDLLAARGQELGYSDWYTVTQDQIALFADATGDHQWIHTDPARAADGPFGTTIAHGFLTLSLIPRLAGDIYRVEGCHTKLNYGLNRVRFPAPVPTGARLRAHALLIEAAEVEGGIQTVSRITVAIDAQPKPACVADTVARLLF